jgi:hypothetical protein
MHFCAKAVSATASGDYYQLVFEPERTDQGYEHELAEARPYLLIQNQFEFIDDGQCYVESDDATYIGSFKLRLVEFTTTRLAFEITGSRPDHVDLKLALSVADFEESLPVAEVIFGIRDPYPDNEA